MNQIFSHSRWENSNSQSLCERGKCFATRAALCWL